MGDTSRRVIVIGIDGADWSVIQLLMAQGGLPHLASLMREGVSADLTSTIPSLTPAAFASFMTGVSPDTHGIFDFVVDVHQNYDPTPINNYTRIPVKTLWDLLTEHRNRIILSAVPLTYPPPEVNGIVVAYTTPVGLPAEISTHPPELKEELLKRLDFREELIRHGLDRFGNVPDERFFDGEAAKHLYVLDKLRQGILYLIKHYDWDFFMVHFAATDQVQHYFWKFMDSTHIGYNPKLAPRYRHIIIDVYHKVDSIIGELMTAIGRDVQVVIMSDHGSSPVHRLFHMNRWLEQHSFLKRHPRTWTLTMRRSTLGRGLEKFGLGKLGSILPGWIRNCRIPLVRRSVKPLDQQIDWQHTKAYAVEVGINVNLQGREPRGIVKPGLESQTLVDDLVEQLHGLQDPMTGKKVVKRVVRKEELYHGPYTGKSPDLFLYFEEDFFCWPSPGLFSSGTIGAWIPVFHDFFSWPSTGRNRETVFKDVDHHDLLSAHHVSMLKALKGILVMKGPSIHAGAQLKEPRIIDLAPTILYLLGLPIPTYMQGRVLEEAIAPQVLATFPPQRISDDGTTPRKEQFSYSPEEEDSIKDKLRRLGYLG